MNSTFLYATTLTVALVSTLAMADGVFGERMQLVTGTRAALIETAGPSDQTTDLARMAHCATEQMLTPTLTSMPTANSLPASLLREAS